jgi:signal transduction histidine kinase
LSALLRPGEDLELLQARSGREALELLLEHEVALALVDVQMPDMDGFELAELMRGAERTRDVPIMFVTAGGSDQQRMFKGYDLGAVDFLFKPIEPQVLRSKTNVFFELYRQRQELKRQLEERTEMLRTNEMFMAILSHDLRNPLNAVLTGAELLRRTTSDEKTRGVVGRIHNSGTRMTEIIERMLDLTRARLGGGIQLTLGPANISEIIHRVVAEQQPEPPGPGIEISEQGDAAGFWDAGRLAQVFSNLVGNALTHGDRAHAVQVTIDGTAPERVVVQVSNAGSAPESIRKHIFDPFSRPKDASVSKRGLGLGLYIVKQLVDGHGGSAVLCSDEPGRTTFVVELPRHAAPPSPDR